MSQNYSDLIDRIQDIRERYVNARHLVMRDHPTYGIRTDIRVNFFSQCINSLDGLYLVFVFYNHHLKDPKCWTQMRQQLHWIVPPPDDLKQWIDNFAIFLKLAFIQTLVSSALESSIRTIAGYVGQKGCDKKGNSFEFISLATV